MVEKKHEKNPRGVRGSEPSLDRFSTARLQNSP